MTMRKDVELLYRGVQMVLRDPHIIPGVVRMEYRHRLGIPWERRFRPGYSAPPTNISVCLTLRCNLKCLMCSTRSGMETPEHRPWYESRREAPLASWITLLDQVAAFRPWIYITGGEPTLSRILPGFIQAARRRRLVVQLQTNGARLAEVADLLVAEGVQAVTVSVDGPPDIHDQIRGVKGSFERLAAGIEALVEARKKRRRPNPVLSLNCTISKANIESLPDMVEWAATLGADVLQFQHTNFDTPENVARHNQVFSPARAGKLGLDLSFPSIAPGKYYQNEITAADLPKLAAGMAQARMLARGRVKLTFLPDLTPQLLAPYYLDLDYPFGEGCDFPWKTLRVQPDGTCSPCLGLNAGNVFAHSFAEVWHGPQFQQLRRFFGQRLAPGCVRCCQRHYLEASRTF
jgi:Fe-coproporphyrin III synthase